jgi:hypothetical protein
MRIEDEASNSLGERHRQICVQSDARNPNTSIIFIPGR